MTTQKSEHEVVVTVSANSHRDAVVFAQHLVGRDDIGRLGVTVVRAVVPEPEDPVVPEILGLLGDLGRRVSETKEPEHRTIEFGVDHPNWPDEVLPMRSEKDADEFIDIGGQGTKMEREVGDWKVSKAKEGGAQ